MIRVNKSGYLYIALTVVIGFSAVNTGNNLVYIVASALLSYMMVSGIFGRNNLKALNVELVFPDEIYAGSDTLVGVRLRCAHRVLPAFLVTVAVSEAEVLFPFLGAGSEDVRYAPLSFRKRGNVSISEIRLSSPFPFNFFTRYRTFVRNHDLVVFAKPIRCDWWASEGELKRKQGEVSVDRVGYDLDILCIRDYVAGDPMKYISWKSTAKTGALKTRDLAAVEARPVILDVDRRRAEDVEWVVGCATYWVLSFLRSRVPVGLIVNGETTRPTVSRAHRITLLRKLALYDPNRRPD